MYVAARQAAERECGVRNWHIVNPEEVINAG
jgi:hypothetical protein